jgi:hypothetical protein
MPQVQMELGDGTIVDDPDQEQVAGAVGRLSPGMWSVVLDRGPGGFMQVAYGTEVGLDEGEFLVIRHPVPGQAGFQLVERDLYEVMAAFKAYARGEDDWATRFAWEALDWPD